MYVQCSKCGKLVAEEKFNSGQHACIQQAMRRLVNETKGQRKLMRLNTKVVTEQQVHAAMNIVLSDKQHYSTTLNWAVNYCTAALRMRGEELRVQCMYVLNNLGKWRHPQAKQVRDTLRAFSRP